nr:RHS repeat protein [Streptomyces sp. XY58]
MFEIYETDVAVGRMSRSHTVTVQRDGVSKPESAPVARADMGILGPGWEAEFVGGQLNRKLEQSGNTAVVTDLTMNAAVTYALKSSLDFPDGGGVRKYATPEGDTLTETTRFNEATGTMVSTAVESANAATSVPDADLSADAAATAPSNFAQLAPTYTWKQVGTGANSWRVTGVGTAANSALSTVTYDTAGRVATVKDAEIGETTSRLLTVKYSTPTTATGTTPGEFTGRVREITLTEGATVQTLARYSYDATGRLRSVANPAEGIDAASSYSYDTTGRVSAVASPANGNWELTFPAGSASPNVEPVGPACPAADAPATRRRDHRPRRRQPAVDGLQQRRDHRPAGLPAPLLRRDGLAVVPQDELCSRLQLPHRVRHARLRLRPHRQHVQGLLVLPRPEQEVERRERFPHHDEDLQLQGVLHPEAARLQQLGVRLLQGREQPEVGRQPEERR